jgi:hypothetical protein
LGSKVVALLLGLIISVPPGVDGHADDGQDAQNKTYVSHNCTGMKIEPRRILFACGDGNFYATKLRWRSWHIQKAAGRGRFHKNDCDPSCAEGSFHARKGRLVLRGRMYCEEKDKYSYTRARIRYRKPLLGKKRERFKLFCPL